MEVHANNWLLDLALIRRLYVCESDVLPTWLYNTRDASEQHIPIRGLLTYIDYSYTSNGKKS